MNEEGSLILPSAFQPLGHVKALAGTLAATTGLILPALSLKPFGGRTSLLMPKLWHKAVSRAIGVVSSSEGGAAGGGVLYVCNHISWLDIPVLGSHLEGSFVAKAEVSRMGPVGFLANLQNTIYVERERRQSAATQANTIQSRLKEGGNVILFPEGTSNDGIRTLPFKSSLFSVTEGEGLDNVRIQPITLAYTRLNGLPLIRQRMVDIAWIGDMEFGAHALDVMRLGRIEAKIIRHEPVRRSDFSDRKALARYCQDVISTSYIQVMRG